MPLTVQFWLHAQTTGRLLEIKRRKKSSVGCSAEIMSLLGKEVDMVERKLPPSALVQCQAMISTGPETVKEGGPAFVRCPAQAFYIVHEPEPWQHEVQGSMALCRSCMKVFKKQQPEVAATAVALN